MDESVKELQKQLTWEFPHIAGSDEGGGRILRGIQGVFK